MIVIYTFVLCIVIILIYWIRFKIKNPFWSCQPVNHPHHFYRRFSRPFIITNNFYIHKFINPLAIKTESWESFKKQNDLKDFIQTHFYNKHKFKYLPELEKHIDPYFTHDKNSFISTYRTANVIVGTITNRTLVVHLDTTISFNTSYIDFLCVHKGYRKKMVAPELIQTHEHFQRTKSQKKCLVSLFKKEGTLHNFTPLCQFNTYTLTPNNINVLSNTERMPSHLKLMRFSLSTFKTIHQHLEEIRKGFSVSIVPPIETVMELVERKSIHIFGLINLNTQNICASYWYRDTGFYVDDEKPNLECFTSTMDNISISTFFAGFMESYSQLKKDYNLLQLEGLGNNTYLVDHFIKNAIQFKYHTPCAYYLYNFSYSKVNAKHCFIVT